MIDYEGAYETLIDYKVAKVAKVIVPIFGFMDRLSYPLDFLDVFIKKITTSPFRFNDLIHSFVGLSAGKKISRAPGHYRVVPFWISGRHL